MFTRMVSWWRGFSKKSRTFEEQALSHLPDLYRVALLVSGNRGDAEGAVERAYRQVREEGGWKRQNLRLDLLRCLLIAVGNGHCGGFEAQDVVVACLFRLPLSLRAVLMLDAIGLEAAEIAEVMGFPVAKVLAWQQEGWDALVHACSEESPRACLEVRQMLRPGMLPHLSA